VSDIPLIGFKQIGKCLGRLGIQLVMFVWYLVAPDDQIILKKTMLLLSTPCGIQCCVIFEVARGQVLQNLQRLGENSAVLALCSEAQPHRLELSALSGLASLGRKAT
jgi:hypothetical protein